MLVAVAVVVSRMAHSLNGRKANGASQLATHVGRVGWPFEWLGLILRA